MKKIITLFFLFITIKVFAQFTTYSTYDVRYDYVGQVEDMEQNEIKSYNKWLEDGMSDTLALSLINAGRAYLNLLEAPPTIVKYAFSIQDDGSAWVGLTLINSTPKLIKEATFTFDFENSDGEQVYDIKTGNKYLVLKFRNLKGRTSSKDYFDIDRTLYDALHFLNVENAIGHPSFTNKRAQSIKLIKAKITYANGTTTNKVAIFQGKNLAHYGPLMPHRIYGDNYLKRNN